jgi:hypothetical protein
MASKTGSERWKPGAHKLWLYLAAGVVWLAVGVMLMSFAARWLRPVPWQSAALLTAAGIGLAAAIYALGFGKLARRNIQRIAALPAARPCLFAFQAWPSYPLVGFMMGLGIYLRLYAPFPKPLLAILYLGIGGGLSSSSLHYFQRAVTK